MATKIIVFSFHKNKVHGNDTATLHAFKIKTHSRIT